MLKNKCLIIISVLLCVFSFLLGCAGEGKEGGAGFRNQIDFSAEQEDVISFEKPDAQTELRLFDDFRMMCGIPEYDVWNHEYKFQPDHFLLGYLGNYNGCTAFVGCVLNAGVILATRTTVEAAGVFLTYNPEHPVLLWKEGEEKPVLRLKEAYDAGWINENGVKTIVEQFKITPLNDCTYPAIDNGVVMEAY